MVRNINIYIYIYIYCEIWCLKIYEKCVWVFCEECVCKTYGSMRSDTMKVKYSKYMRLFVL